MILPLSNMSWSIAIVTCMPVLKRAGSGPAIPNGSVTLQIGAGVPLGP
jgi:hypothetical protein